MANIAILIGINSGNRSILLEGNPVEIRRVFFKEPPDGYDRLEVWTQDRGREQGKDCKRSGIRMQEATPQPEPQNDPEPEPDTDDGDDPADALSDTPKRRGRPPKQ